jgi:hypothetical protein
MHCTRGLLIVNEGSLKEGRLRAEPDGLVDGHSGADAELTGTVRGGLHHAALLPAAAYDQQVELAQLGMALAADFDEESVEINVKDSCGHRGSLHEMDGCCLERDHHRSS